ncbi:MarR family transcriptional regulator [Ectothiorhodospiraceae bacterium WFHF3C12]|nr:MarR family transcriptional regulator [Ectothiorhodospiraceae bacterium WFHF3C12]
MDERSHIDAFGVVLFEAARAWRQELDRRLRPLGLSQAKWRTIVNIHRAGEGITQKALAERLGIEGPTLVRLLDRLAEDGWIERRECPQDRRSKRVFLLERAKEAMRHIESVAAGLRQDLLGDLPPDELRICFQTLERVRRQAEDLE